MAKNYPSLAFTNAVKEMQEKFGSRASYARLEKNTYVDGLTANESEFISQRDSFYMASTGENGFPYVQFRGGPKGFLKVLSPKRVAFIDFRGNKQYISIGNIAANNKVALIMVDYPARARLKIYAKATISELDDEPALYELLDLHEYKFNPEQLIVLQIEAYDWNCPQHITPRYTIEETYTIYAAQLEYMHKLEDEINMLKAKLKEKAG